MKSKSRIYFLYYLIFSYKIWQMFEQIGICHTITIYNRNASVWALYIMSNQWTQAI